MHCEPRSGDCIGPEVNRRRPGSGTWKVPCNLSCVMQQMSWTGPEHPTASTTTLYVDADRGPGGCVKQRRSLAQRSTPLRVSGSPPLSARSQIAICRMGLLQVAPFAARTSPCLAAERRSFTLDLEASRRHVPPSRRIIGDGRPRRETRDASRRRPMAASAASSDTKSQNATMPSPPAAPGTSTDPMLVNEPPGATWNSSTVPVPPVCT